MSARIKAGKRFPTTRFQGSKLKLLPWLRSRFAELDFDTCLDAFGGTSCVGYLLKTMGKAVTVNDLLRAHATSARALVQNSSVRLNPECILDIAQRKATRDYQNFIEANFEDLFYLPHENRWLDTVAQNIDSSLTGYERDLALFALFQACLAKRPYNLFHRANLYMRTANVKRSFGNKTTWDRAFEDHFVEALALANSAVFDSGREHSVVHGDVLDVPGQFDLVYLDPPYMNSRGVSVNYLDFYHFLEGLTEYATWGERIEMKYRHRPYRRVASPWLDKQEVENAFCAVFERYAASTLVVSYRDNGIPSPVRLESLLLRYKRTVNCHTLTDYKYVLSKTRSKELLFVAT